jgi:hypothetical protein
VKLWPWRKRDKPPAVTAPDTYELTGGQVVYNVHPPTGCLGGPCAIHNPTRHPMIDWPQNWRDDRKLMERICPHGIGHPDPDHVTFVTYRAGAQFAAWQGTHGCDGCCQAAP